METEVNTSDIVNCNANGFCKLTYKLGIIVAGTLYDHTRQCRWKGKSNKNCIVAGSSGAS